MEEQVIKCPHCGEDIPLTEAISHQVREELQREFREKFNRREKDLEARARSLSAREKELNEARADIEEEVASKLKGEREKLSKEAGEKAREELGAELDSLKVELKEKRERIRDFRNRELELRREQEQLQEEKEGFELELSRKLAEERARFKEEIVNSLREEYGLKERELREKIEGMKRQLEEARRKAEQGSQQAQGEAMELELEEELRGLFPLDVIEAVPRGIRGADVIQRVIDDTGRDCGAIIWEVKRTKNWSNAWIEKLKQDQREAKADIAVIRTAAMPAEVKGFGCLEGVWVTNFNSLPGLAAALRINLIQLAGARIAAVGKNEKMELLYGYLSGRAFKQNVASIVEAFEAMKEDLEREKRSLTRIWAKREKQMEKIIHSTATLYGDMQGIIGASIPEIDSLELKALEAGEDEEEY